MPTYNSGFMKARFKSKKYLSFSQEHLSKLNIFVPLNPRLHKATARWVQHNKYGK